MSKDPAAVLRELRDAVIEGLRVPQILDWLGTQGHRARARWPKLFRPIGRPRDEGRK